METLVIVDFQKDFSNPKGSLYVPGAENAEQAIINYINTNHKNISDVVFTVDWHSPNHCSFKDNGGEWPIHCVQFSEGAGISDELIKICMLYNLNIKVFKKGNVDECEEYGAFEYIGTYHYGEGDADIIVNNIANKNTLRFDTANIVVCGLAGDYCVKETIKNIMQYKGPIGINIAAFKDGIASIDGGSTLNNFISENNLLVKTI